MTTTDREILKNQQKGALATTDAVTPLTAVADAHTRSRDFMKTGTENAATNVASTLMFSVKRKTRCVAADYLTGTNVAADITDYVVISLKKKTAGATAVVVATYNTHTSAQGAITTDVRAAFVPVPNADSTLAANDTLHYTLDKYGAGKAVAIGTFTFDGEEI